jgi:hypothetical protein
MQNKKNKEWLIENFNKSTECYLPRTGAFEDEERRLTSIEDKINNFPSVMFQRLNEIRHQQTEYFNDSEIQEHWKNCWGFNMTFTIENSILAKFQKSNDLIICLGIIFWLLKARHDFEMIVYGSYTLSFLGSIDELKLAEMELRELNKFFEAGAGNSSAIFDVQGYVRYNFSEGELYEYYLKILKGRFKLFIDSEESFREAIEQKGKYEFKKEFWLAARIQALMWLKIYLEKIIELKEFSFLPKISLDDLVEKQNGFHINKPSKILPEIYRLLLENGLIRDEGEDSFKRSFMQGEGKVKWEGTQNQLSYFIKELRNNGIIFNNDNFKTASNVFIKKNKPIDKDTLRVGYDQIIDRRKKVIDDIISKILVLI